MFKKKYHKYIKKNETMYGGLDVQQLKENYVKFIEGKNVSSELTIATYNVHYFTDVNEAKNTYKNIIFNIGVINADVMILQEALIGGANIKINDKVTLDLSTLYEDLGNIGYHKIIFCNTTPSWYAGTYGNIMLIHDRIASTMCKKMTVCEELNENNFVFPKATTSTQVSGKHQGTLETRCYIYVSIEWDNHNYHIYGTHLDVASENTRLHQIKTLINSAENHQKNNDIVIIMGDFNTFSIHDKNRGMTSDLWNSEFTRNNGSVVEYLEYKGYHDLELLSMMKNNISNITMTTWNNTRVDFIFCNKIPVKFGIEHLYSDASDHLPTILKLGKNVSFEQKFQQR